MSESDELAKKILSVAQVPRTVMFTGAGVGVRVGLPNWPDYIEHLAKVSSAAGDSDSATLIRKRMKKGQLIAAAAVYKTADIPAGERLKQLGSLFVQTISPAKRKLIEPLFALPVSAAVTTNYDRLLHRGFAKHRDIDPIPLELDDSTLKNGALRTEFFVARIHGRAEKPETMVVDTSDYAGLDRHPDYLDFLLALLTQRPCLFVGFSFADPAITKVLTVFKTKAGPSFPTLHHALLGSDATPELHELLKEVNVQIISYKATDQHRLLWSALGTIQRSSRADPAVVDDLQEIGSLVPDVTRSAFERFFAFSYAQLKSRSLQGPLLEISEDGLVSALISEEGLTEKRLVEKVASELHVSESESQAIVATSLRRLGSDGRVVWKADTIHSTQEPGPIYDEHIAVLASGVLSRMRVREGVTVSEAHKSAVSTIIEQVFIVRLGMWPLITRVQWAV